MKTLWKIAMVMAASVLLAVPSAAEEADSGEAESPAYSVARLKVFEGSVWVRTPDSGDWEEFLHNSPVAGGSRISVPEGSEGELQFHGGQFMLLTGGTEIDIRTMGVEKTDFRLKSGEIRFDLPDADFSPVQVAVPDGGSLDFPVPGRYWVTAGEGTDSRLVVRSGESTVTVASGQFPVRAGEEAAIGRDVRISRYSGDEADTYEKPPPLTEEEQEAGIPPAAAYELREYGEWVYTPENGYVWRPRVADGWSPYYYGRWEWISPYGWVWIAYEPWGWYPYHYGYWYDHYAYGWVWYPYYSFFSVSFVFGHHHHAFHHFHRDVFFHSSNVRFVRDGRSVRWVPLRPGERHARAGFTRADKRLATWNRPLERGKVFVRRSGQRGGEWRDFASVRGERLQGSRTDVRRDRGGAAGIAGARSARFERDRLPVVRMDSGERGSARSSRTRETRIGTADLQARSRTRIAAPATSRERGTFSRITRGEPRSGEDAGKAVGGSGEVRGRTRDGGGRGPAGAIQRDGGSGRPAASGRGAVIRGGAGSGRGFRGAGGRGPVGAIQRGGGSGRPAASGRAAVIRGGAGSGRGFRGASGRGPVGAIQRGGGSGRPAGSGGGAAMRGGGGITGGFRGAGGIRGGFQGSGGRSFGFGGRGGGFGGGRR